MDLDATEIRFAQQLAANEKKQRDKSLKKLRKYLQVKSKKKGFTHEDFLRIWKGLHYCMWMQDKPLIHEELCTKVSQLVHDLANNESRWLFIKVFIVTEVREWNGIDVWRLDKFMMMFRAVLTESLVALKNQNWKFKAVEGLLAVYSETMLSATEDVPFGLRSHFIDIFLDELNKVGGSKISAKLFMQILEPFIKLLQELKNPDSEVSRKIIHSVFDPIVQRTTRLSIAKGNKKQQNGSRSYIKFPDLQIDSKMIADHLFDLSNTDSTTSRKRDMFYQIVKRLQDACDGIQPVAPEAPQKIAIPRQMIGGAVSDLLKLETELNWKPSKKQLKAMKKQKVKRNGKENSSEIIDVPMAQLEEPKVRAGKKRKHSAVVDDDDEVTVTKAKRKAMDEKEDAKVDNETESAEIEMTPKSPKSGKAKKKEKLRVMEAKSQNGNKTTATPQKDLLEVKTQKAAQDTTLTPKLLVANNVTPKPVKGKFTTPKADKSKGKTTVKKMNSPQMANSKPELNKSGQWLIENSQDLKENGEKLIETTDKGAVTKENKGNSKGVRKRKISDVGADFDQNKGQSNSKEWTMTEQVDALDSKPVSNDVSVSSVIQIKPSNDLDAGEVEIFVPSKKYKGKVNMSPATKFAQFENKKTPIAFVKRALAKSNKNVSVTPACIKRMTATPSSIDALTGSAKKVYFNMKKNQSQSFKDSLNSPIVPFNPTKTPDQSILKSGANGTPGTGNVRRAGRKVSADTPPSSASLKSLKTPKRTLSHKTVQVKAAPVMSLNAVLKKKVARDFFAL